MMAKKGGLYLAAVAAVAALCFVGNVQAQDEADSGLSTGGPETVEINWMQKMQDGGLTMVFLGILSVAGFVFAGERLIFLRAKYIAPVGFAAKVGKLIEQKNAEGIITLCKKNPSTLATATQYIVEHQEQSLTDVSNSVGDIAGREIRDMMARNNPLAVIAALSPLLGLLGTMIGMIEAFELVAIYGDEGGASMLAGSIAKALITTAAGLIIAIPAIAAYNYFKHRVNKLTMKLENDVELILDKMS
jgi:biopolymer transport protein ExbB